MKFPRNARIFRGQLDAAPFASVFFLLVIFMLVMSLLYTPGVQVHLPETDDKLPGTDRPTISIAVDASGQFYYQNKRVTEKELQSALQAAVKASSQPLELVVQRDKAATEENLIRLAMIARKAGIRYMLLATLPRP